MNGTLPWIDSVIVGLLLTLAIYLVYRLIRLRNITKSISELYMQELADKALLKKKVEQLYQDIENMKLEQTDGFLKFVSDSRDWAFQYIEEVQKALSEFDKDIAPSLKWASTFGMVNGSNAHTETIQTISDAYDKLKSVLPKETETPNN